MTPSQVAQIILRLFALLWGFQGIAYTAASAIAVGRDAFSLTTTLPGVGTVIFALILWLLSGKISKQITKGNNERIAFGGVSFFQLLVATFVGLGLYFCLSSFGSVLNWIHYLVISAANAPSLPSGVSMSYYDLTKEGITFGAGVFLIFASRNLAAKIEKRSEARGGDT